MGLCRGADNSLGFDTLHRRSGSPASLRGHFAIGTKPSRSTLFFIVGETFYVT
jgi:hypothetical protein